MAKYKSLIFVFITTLFYFPSSLAKTYTVGISDPYAPYILESPSNMYYGFDISVMNKVCEELEISCTYKQMHFDELLPSIENGSIDFSISAITITKDRQKKINFTMPYAPSHARYAVHKNKVAYYKTMNQSHLSHKRVGVVTGTVYHSYMESLHLPDTKVLLFENSYDQISALLDDKIDILITDNQAAQWWQAKTSHTIITVGEPFSVGKGLGIAVSKEYAHYLSNFNQAITALKRLKMYQLLKAEYLLAR